MARVQDILARKGNEVISVGKQARVVDAAAMMNERRIGALVVTDGGEVAGIVTERDVLRKVVAVRHDPAEVSVDAIMSSEVICCSPEASVEEARSIFKAKRIRHLPVVGDDGRLLGMISIGDVNAWQLDDQEMHIHYLSEYLHRRVY
ncbi:MAG: CBS domain-containing protein [Phycisphaeraceae bacterium]